jgi:hypothetical protein
MLRNGRDVVILETGGSAGMASEGTLGLRSNLFASLLKFEAQIGEELRADDIVGGDRYHGRAPDGTAEDDAAWEVVRFIRDVQANILRVQYRSDLAWDDRTNPTNWS